MINKQLYRKMVSEVSLPVLVGLIADSLQTFQSAEEVNDDVIEQVNLIDIVTSEIKSRKPKQESSRRRNQQEATPQTSGITLNVSENGR